MNVDMDMLIRRIFIKWKVKKQGGLFKNNKWLYNQQYFLTLYVNLFTDLLTL